MSWSSGAVGAPFYPRTPDYGRVSPQADHDHPVASQSSSTQIGGSKDPEGHLSSAGGDEEDIPEGVPQLDTKNMSGESEQKTFPQTQERAGDISNLTVSLPGNQTSGSVGSSPGDDQFSFTIYDYFSLVSN